jgi:uncharacterized membrane protein (UPF0127 family)
VVENMSKKITRIGLLIITFPLIAAGCNPAMQPTASDLQNFRIGEHSLQVEVANTEAAREQGLSNRESLAPDSGMLFVFETPGQYAFWMKDMKFPLDFVWIRDGRVVEVTSNVPVERGVEAAQLKNYRPAEEIDSMLELNAGWAAAHSIQVNSPALVEGR